MSFTLQDSFPASPATNGDFFGVVAISRDGSTIVVGAPQQGLSAHGKVYVLHGTSFATQTILTASDGANGDLFGDSVAVSADGSVVVVGSPNARNGSSVGHAHGAVYVYTGASWGTQTKLSASDATIDAHFGRAVAISDDGATIAAGAPGWNGSATNMGKAYVRTGASWATETGLVASDGAHNNEAGIAIAISASGAIVAIGAFGKAYARSGASWATETKIIPTSPAAGFFFGLAIALNADGLVLAVGDNSGNGVFPNGTGAAFIYTGAAWGTEQVILASDGAPGDNFGGSVALSPLADRFAVGAVTAPNAGASFGQAYVYEGVGYASEEIIADPSTGSGDFFGGPVMFGLVTQLVVGATGYPDGNDAGAAYYYTAPGPPPPPRPCAPSLRQYRAVRGRVIVTDLFGATTTWLERGSLLQADVTANLNLPSQIACQTRAGDPAVYSIFPTDGDPLVAQSNRLVYVFLNEDPYAVSAEDRWVCRASGILMSPQDQADADIGTTHFTAYDPWQFFMGLPCFADTIGNPIPQKGLLFPHVHGDEIAFTMIQNTIESMLALGWAGPGFFADIPNAFGGTTFYSGYNTGAYTHTPYLDFNVQQGTSLGQLLQQLASAGSDIPGTSQCIDIVFEPIYDPANRPGYTSQISIYDLAGSERPKAQMAWGRFQRSAMTADRQHDGTPGAFVNLAQFVAGQGGDSSDILLYPYQESFASIFKYGPYALQKFFPAQFDSTVVENLAVQALQLQKQGKRTFLVDVDPLRAAMPFRDYNIGDRIGVWTSHALRAPASGDQRVQTIPLSIGPDGVCVVSQLLTSPDWPQDEGS